SEAGVPPPPPPPSPVDWVRDVWRHCRLHRVSTSPLFLPVASSTLTGFSVNTSTAAGEDDDNAEATSLIVEAARFNRHDTGRFSGPWGGIYVEGDGRWGSGMVGSVSDKDPVTSPKDWGLSGHRNTAVMTTVGEGPSSELWSGDRRPTQSSEFEEEAELMRSRSATSSGLGRDSLDSNADPDERWGLPSATSVRGGGEEFGGGGEGDGGGGGGGADDLRQTRSASLAAVGVGWDGGGSFGRDAGGITFAGSRRKSSALDNILLEDPAAPGSASASTPSGRGERAVADDGAARVAEAERAAVLARQFVLAYSSYLVTHLGFTPVAGATNRPAERAAAAPVAPAEKINSCSSGSRKQPKKRPAFEGEASTPASSHSRSATGWGKEPFDGDGAGGGGGGGGGPVETRVSDFFCSPATRGSGGVLLAHALLRLGLELTNTVALVEVSVMVAPPSSTAAAAAGGAQRQPMQSSVKFWTIDVVEPPSGWEGDGPIGGAVEGESASRSWWADLPTLSSFKWNLDPNSPTFRGSELPDELPHEMYRVIHKLRLRNAVEDFMVGQVEAALLSSTAADSMTAATSSGDEQLRVFLGARPDEQLRILFAHNAHSILSLMAAENDAAYFEGSRPCESDDPPAVTREIISIELDAERGPLLEPSPLRPSTVGAGAAAGAAAARGGDG
ncbi:unnamed protein product, partial [Scytosiphon promiscuus]